MKMILHTEISRDLFNLIKGCTCLPVALEFFSEMKPKFPFIKFIWGLLRKRPWHYAAGTLSVVILDAVDMVPSLLIKEMTNKVQRAPQDVDLTFYALALAGCYLLISLLRLGWRFLIIIPSRLIEKDLRKSAYQKIVSSDFAEVSKLKTGDVVSTLSQELANLRMFMGPGVVVMIDTLALFILIPATLFYILGPGALYVLLPFLILIGVIVKVQKPLEKAYGESSEMLGNLSQYVFEEAQGARFFRAEGLIEARRMRYEMILKSLFGKQLEISRLDLSLDASLQTIFQMSYLVVLTLAWKGHGEMAQGLGALTVSLQLLDKLLWPLMSVGYIINSYQGAVTAWKRLEQIESLTPKIQGTQKISEPLHSISIKNLSIKAPTGLELLSHIDLKIKSGEHIAIVGTIGSGKTVFLQTLAGLWEGKHLSYDEFSFNQVSFKALNRETLWEQLSFIPQTPQIFSRTLALNISPQRHLIHDNLMASLEKADLAADVALFPEGLSTAIGEKGINLSGGQKQRTLISRSFHSEAKLFLWDDAISALDPKTEKKVIQNLRHLDPTAILILATHRLSSLKDFDRILVMEKGQIVRTGSFDEIKRDHVLFERLLQDEQEALKKEEPWI